MNPEWEEEGRAPQNEDHARFMAAFWPAARQRDEEGMRAAIAAYRALHPIEALDLRLAEASVATFMGREEEGLAILDEIIDAGLDREVRARRRRADVRLRLNDFAGARADLDVIVRHEDVIAPVYRDGYRFMLARALANLGDPAFEASLEGFDPGKLYYAVYMLRPFRLREGYHIALEDRAQGLADAPRLTSRDIAKELFSMRTSVAMRDKDEAGMRLALKLYRASVPDDIYEHRSAEASIARVMGREDEALDILNDILAFGIDRNERAREKRADVFMRRGDYKAALADLEIVLQAPPEFSYPWRTGTLFRHATALAELGDPAFEVAVESLPDGCFYVPSRLVTAQDLRKIYAVRKAEREQGGAT